MPLVAGAQPQGLSSGPVARGDSRPVVAVVLSGGGALGLAHIGVLKVIDSLGIPVKIVVGTSMGAVVGGLYAFGYAPTQIAAFAEKADWDELFSDAPVRSLQSFHEKTIGERYQLRLGFDRRGLWAGQGLISGQNVTTLLELLTLGQAGTNDFDRLPRRYRAVAMDILTGQEVVLSGGSLADAMRASMSIPAIFSPYPIGGRYLVDGGAVDSLPVDIAKRMGADIVIAVRVRTPSLTSPEELTSPIAVLTQTSRLMVQRSIDAQARLADLLIEPDLTGLRSFEFTRAKDFVVRGEQAGKECLPRLEAIAALAAGAPPSIGGSKDSIEDGSLPGADNRPAAELLKPSPSRERIAGLAIEGAVGDDAEVIAASFRPLVGRRIEGNELRAAVDRTYESGRFDFVRFRFGEPADGARELIVGVAPAASTTSSLLFGVDYAGSWSASVSNSLDIAAGLAVQGLTGKGSQLLVEGMFVDTQYLSLEYYQPVGGYLFLDPFAKLLRYYGYRVVGAAQVGLPSHSLGGGFWAGIPIGYEGQIRAGYSIASVLTYGQDRSSKISESVAAAKIALELDSRPTALFPDRGIYAEIGYERALPALGGSAQFHKLASDLQVNLPLGEAVTLAFTLSGGTDFTASPSEPGVLSLSSAFDLRGMGLFHGYDRQEVVGSHKAVAGLDARLRVFPLSQVFGSDVYLLANASLGNCWQDPPPTLSNLAVRYGGSLGIGARIERSFGLRMLASLIDSGRFQLSLDLGSMSERPFDSE